MKAFGEVSDFFKSKEKELRIVARQDQIMILRLDGKNFSGLKRKYNWQQDHAINDSFVQAMLDLTRVIVEQYNPTSAFVGSDEISLVFINSERSEHIFGGRYEKITSLMGCFVGYHATRIFQDHNLVPQEVKDPVLFDCRMIVLNPDESHLVNDYLNHRAHDVHRNALRTDAQRHLSHNQLHKIGDKWLVKVLLDQHGIILEDKTLKYYGHLFSKRTEERPLVDKIGQEKFDDLLSRGFVKPDATCNVSEWKVIELDNAGLELEDE